MSPELSRRLGNALGGHVVTVDERNRVVAAAERPTVERWNDLPRDVQRLVVEIENRPPTLDMLEPVPGPTKIVDAPPSEPNRFVLE